MIVIDKILLLCEWLGWLFMREENEGQFRPE